MFGIEILGKEIGFCPTIYQNTDSLSKEGTLEDKRVYCQRGSVKSLIIGGAAAVERMRTNVAELTWETKSSCSRKG